MDCLQVEQMKCFPVKIEGYVLKFSYMTECFCLGCGIVVVLRTVITTPDMVLGIRGRVVHVSDRFRYLCL